VIRRDVEIAGWDVLMLWKSALALVGSASPPILRSPNHILIFELRRLSVTVISRWRQIGIALGLERVLAVVVRVRLEISLSVTVEGNGSFLVLRKTKRNSISRY
jgi:hypothetical protein